jgi:BirA family biotin operon repressor/biotin-[acetyl-CoA-carboxylase] ligase
MKPSPSPVARKTARDLHRRSTDSERLLWMALRGRQIGPKFRRQHPVGPYVLDFYCHEPSLAIEIDGSYHDFTAVNDAQRQRFLEAQGIRFIRVLADDVEKHREAVVSYVRAEVDALQALTPGPSPTSRERGGQVASRPPHSGSRTGNEMTGSPSPARGRGMSAEGGLGEGSRP